MIAFRRPPLRSPPSRPRLPLRSSPIRRRGRGWLLARILAVAGLEGGAADGPGALAAAVATLTAIAAAASTWQASGSLPSGRPAWSTSAAAGALADGSTGAAFFRLLPVW